jgi:hypothetical protein
MPELEPATTRSLQATPSIQRALDPELDPNPKLASWPISETSPFAGFSNRVDRFKVADILVLMGVFATPPRESPIAFVAGALDSPNRGSRPAGSQRPRYYATRRRRAAALRHSQADPRIRRPDGSQTPPPIVGGSSRSWGADRSQCGRSPNGLCRRAQQAPAGSDRGPGDARSRSGQSPRRERSVRALHGTRRFAARGAGSRPGESSRPARRSCWVRRSSRRLTWSLARCPFHRLLSSGPE